jgi:Ser/Thr protein kinase RdoA (MazF antagonist)
MGEIFPAQYSTLSSRALATYVQDVYGLRHVSCRYLLRGVSDTYVVDSVDGKYILKVYRGAHRSWAEINGEVALLRALYDQGAKVSPVVSDREGKGVQTFQAAEGARHGVLSSFAPGKNVYDLSDKQLHTVGREMAFNHNITAGLDLPFERKSYTVDTTLIQPLHSIRRWFIDFPEGYAFLQTKVDDAVKTLENYDTAKFNYGYCHYDYLPKNFHFDENDGFTLFDFDFAGKGFLVNDLASFTIHLYFHMFFKKLGQGEAEQAFRKVVQGYREQRPIADEELRAIPTLGFMFWLFYLGFQCENFDDWSNTFMGPRYLRDRVATIQDYATRFADFAFT